MTRADLGSNPGWTEVFLGFSLNPLRANAATSTAEKAIQVRSDRDRLGEGSLSDTDRSVVEIYRGCSETAVSPPRSTKSDSIGSTRPRIWGKKPLSPRLAHEPCTSSTNRRKPKYRMAHQQTSKEIGTNDSVTHDPTPNIPFRGIPLVFNYDTWIFRPQMRQLCRFTFPLTWKVASSEKQTRVRNVQDGAPPHFANMVRTFLDEQFPARWIGRGSPYITWPARSPDLTPPDFFLWGFVKDQVYRTPVRDLADLQERIYAAVNNVTPQMLHNTWVEVEYRWIFPVPLEAMLRFVEHKFFNHHDDSVQRSDGARVQILVDPPRIYNLCWASPWSSPRLYDVQQELGKMAIEGSTAAGENRTSNVTRRNSDEARRVFPFQYTPSGNLKIVPNQVVFESKKVSVLVADPKHTKVNVKAEIGNPTVTETQKPLSVQTLNQGHPEGSFPLQQQSEEEFYPNEMGDDCMEEIEVADESEQNLTELGFTSSEPIDWSNVSLPNKSDLYKLLRYRINNYINPDCVVHVGNEEFNCHHLILQCYSSYFDKAYFKEAELPEVEIISMICDSLREMSEAHEEILCLSDSGSKRQIDIIGINSSKSSSEIIDLTIRFELSKEQPKEGHVEKKKILSTNNTVFLNKLEEQCWAFIECDELFSEETAFFLYLDAKKYGHTAIMEMMIPRIMKFFLTLVSSKDFLELSAEELCEFLRSNYICVHSEMEVFMSAVRWLMHDWKRRQKHLIEVMTCIRFGLCAPWQLIDIQRNPENPEFVELMSNADVQKLVEEGVALELREESKDNTLV
ncbi:hypothetical protein ANN_08308 [Periplaneta americana]|uniref:BACK domain-containing protein n=1 Tax=Periplaneta americana TaxID=6978 RepID=A0ABQ8T121_PERAM|nr:hypothetical protein ANN_08308 [Periplaneta americana]